MTAFTRRIAGAAALAVTLGAWGGAARAEPDLHAPIDDRSLKVLGNAPAIAVAGYRVVFVVSNGIDARSIHGNSSSRTTVYLGGVSGADLQRIADAAYEDLMQRLEATGRPIVPLETIRSSPGFAKLELTPTSPDKPFLRKPLADARTFAAYTPAALPLWWSHLDGVGDKGAGSLGNWRALNQLSVDTQAVVIVPQITFDFAELKGSGRDLLAGAASTSAKADFRILEQFTVLRAFQAKIALAGPLGAGTLKKPIDLPEPAGELKLSSQWDNQQEVAFANSLKESGVDVLGPSRSVSEQELAFIAEPNSFVETALEGTRQFNAMVAAAVAAYR